MTQIQQSSNDFKQFKKFIEDLTPQSGFCGGRYFKQGKTSYSMNQIVLRFEKYVPLSLKTTPKSEIDTMLERIKKLDNGSII